MPTLYNLDHQHAIIGPDVSVAPGAAHDFTDEQVAAGISGRWSENDPRAGLDAERKFKAKRDRDAKPDSAVPADTETPAEPEKE